MKLIAKNTNIDYLNTMQVLLEKNGIPAIVNGENTTMKGKSYVRGESSLWVHLDEQSAEAMRLIDDPEYQVMHSVDVKQFYLDAESVNNNRIKTIVRFGVATLFIFLGIFILLKVISGLAI